MNINRTRDQILKVFENPSLVDNFVKSHPRYAPKKWYVEHNGNVLGVKLAIFLAYSDEERPGPNDFMTDEARTFLKRLGFENIIDVGRARDIFVETHCRREANFWTRNAKLRNEVIKSSNYRCQACGLAPQEKYDGPKDGCLETHHIEPLSESIETQQHVSQDNLACLCANCHRMIHRLIAKTGSSVSLEQFKSTIRQAQPHEISR